MVLNAEQHRQRRALQKYAHNAAGKLVRAAAFRACDYTETGLLREFTNEDEVLAFEADCYNDGSGYQVRFSSKPRATVPQEQLALQASLEQAVEEDGNQTRLQLTSVEEGLHAHLDDISQRLDAVLQQNPPATSALAAPGDVRLMARVQKSFKVARMNAILKECSVARQPGMKMADKAALIVEKVPRDRLLSFLETAGTEVPAMKRSRTEQILPPSSDSNLITRHFHNDAASPNAEGHQPETQLAANASTSLGELYEKCVPSSAASAGTNIGGPFSPTSSTSSDHNATTSPGTSARSEGTATCQLLPSASAAGADYQCCPIPRLDDGAGNLKLAELQSATCSTASGATSPTSADSADRACPQPLDGTDALPAADGDAPRQPKESAVDIKLRHIDAVEVMDVKGRFSHWAPLTVEGLCGHPCSDGKLCNNNAGDCFVHRQREKTFMGREDECSAILGRGLCGVPLGKEGFCQKALGRCKIHTEDWDLRRELCAMRAEDDISCIADRGRCGVVPRGGGDRCDYPRGRCPRHAEEKERCQSALDCDPQERCWNHRAEGSRFCQKHADYPDLSVAVQRWVAERQRKGVPLDEEEFMAYVRAGYPDASYQQPKIHDFQKFAVYFANLGVAAERSRSRSPKRS